MEVTETRKVARKIIKASGEGHTIFNDRLVDGRRSLKVWGWDKKMYELCQQELMAQGHIVKLVSFLVNRWGGSRLQHRLHVLEK